MAETINIKVDLKLKLPFYEKLKYSGIAAVIFLILSLPHTYKIFNKILHAITGKHKLFIDTDTDCPTAGGFFTHSFIFFALLSIVMLIFNFIKKKNNRQSVPLILKYSFYSTLLFFLIANKETYKITNSIFDLGGKGLKIAHKNGCPNVIGVLLHTIAYFGVVFAVMFLPKDP